LAFPGSERTGPDGELPLWAAGRDSL